MTIRSSKPDTSLLRAMYDAAVAAAHPRACLAPHLPDVPAKGRIIVLGAGKASAAMAVACEAHYENLGGLDRLSGTLTTRHGARLATRKLAIVEAGHPVPDNASVAAAGQALTLARGAGPNDLVLVLLSGGASALWSAPVDGVDIAAKQALTKSLLRSGARIGEMNTVRRHLSRIKGGKLAAAARSAWLLTLAISDVPGDDPATIGSGPTVADPTSLGDARAILERFGIAPPEEIVTALLDPANETLKPGDAALSKANYALVATPTASLAAAADLARKAGYDVLELGDSLEGEARDVARVHADMALAAHRQGRRLAILSGGELTVTVTGTGAGGPNQEYALSLALALRAAVGISALAADTDGIDGGSGSTADPAGAMVFHDSLARATAIGLDAAAMLANNDSTAFFARIGDLVSCGPTQTNVNDFRVILVDGRTVPN